MAVEFTLSSLIESVSNDNFCDWCEMAQIHIDDSLPLDRLSIVRQIEIWMNHNGEFAEMALCVGGHELVEFLYNKYCPPFPTFTL